MVMALRQSPFGVVVLSLILTLKCVTGNENSDDHLDIFKGMLDRLQEKEKNQFFRETILTGYTIYLQNQPQLEPSPDKKSPLLDWVCLPLPIGCQDPNDPSIRPHDPDCDPSICNKMKPPSLHWVCLPPPIGCYDPNDPSVRPHDPRCDPWICNMQMNYDSIALTIYTYYKKDRKRYQLERDTNNKNTICFPSPIDCWKFEDLAPGLENQDPEFPRVTSRRPRSNPRID